MKTKTTHRSTRTKNPAYMEYASDILNDELFKSMSMSQRGIFWSMRLYCWVNGDVPSNWKNLGDLIGTKENEIRKAFADDKLFEFFHLNEKMDRFFCPDLEAYREELQIKQRRRQENGKAASDMQWHSKRNGNAIPDGMASDMNRNEMDGDSGVKGFLMRVS